MDEDTSDELSAALFTVRDSGGWYQDEQTLKSANDAVCEITDGSALHFKAETGSGNGRGANASQWPTVFVNEAVNTALTAAETAISGAVTAGGSPVEGAVVTLEDASYMPVAGKTVTTGADGAFSFVGVTEAGCKVKVQAGGYQVTTVDASAETSVALTAVTAGTKIYTNNTGDLTQMGGLTETDAPTFETVDGAVKVTFNSSDRSRNNAVVKAFDFVNGEISFDVTPAGNTSRFGITLRGTAGDNRIFVGQNNTISTWFWNTWTNGSEKYNMNQDQTGVPLSVQSGVTRNVRVKIEGGTVSACLDGIEAYTITLPDGIPAGAGFAGIVANSADPVVIDNIRVVSFDSDEPAPPATYTLSGTVTGESGAAVSGATVTVVVAEKSATTDANGGYSIAGLENGTYDVRVSAPGYDTASKSVTINSANATANIELTKTAAALPELKVTDAEGNELTAENGYYTIPAGGRIDREDNKTVSIPMGIVSIAGSVKTIGAYAFSECTVLKNIDIPEGVTQIKSYAFNGCSALTGIFLPDSVTTLGGWAIQNCSALKTVELPAGISTDGAQTFAGCTGLKNLVLRGAPGTIYSPYLLFGFSRPTDLTVYVNDAVHATEDLTAALSKLDFYRIANLNGYTVVQYMEGALAEPVKDGEAGVWYDEAGNALMKDEDSYILPEGEEFGAVYTVGAPKVGHTVTIDGEKYTVEDGSVLGGILPEDPAREGYTFAGWFDGETEVTADTVVTGEMTITAKWTANPVTAASYTLTINYVDESGSTVAPSYTRRLTSGSSYNVASPAVEGMDPDQAVVSVRLTRNTTVTVVYSANTIIEEPDVPLAELPLSFEDVKDGDWYREAVAYVWSNSLMLGTSDKLFGVEANTDHRVIAVEAISNQRIRPAAEASFWRLPPLVRCISKTAAFCRAAGIEVHRLVVSEFFANWVADSCQMHVSSLRRPANSSCHSVLPRPGSLPSGRRSVPLRLPASASSSPPWRAC